MSQHLVSILVPNYKTLALTQLCLRLLQRYTDLNIAKIIVIDNDSKDESLSYLRSLSWIQLLERSAILGESPAESHSRALDMALDQVDTPYVLSIHTDTLVKHPEWLQFLLSHIEMNPNIAGVGSWKLESKPFFRRFLKQMERVTERLYFHFTDKIEHRLEGLGKNYYYLRSHCALYRTALLKQHDLHFSDGDQVAGKELHKKLVEAGYEMRFLPSDLLIKYLEHINHATTVLNPALSGHQHKLDRNLKRVQRSLEKISAQL
jgi:glycosyltransferase involved in cell wall biosynthesis